MTYLVIATYGPEDVPPIWAIGATPENSLRAMSNKIKAMGSDPDQWIVGEPEPLTDGTWAGLPPYMGGTGISQRTVELTARLWYRLYTVIGVGGAGIIVLWVCVIVGIHLSRLILIVAIPIYLALCVWLSLRWLWARNALQIHTERLTDETNRRGKGWAKD